MSPLSTTASLQCIQTLTPPPSSSNKSISSADSKLFQFSQQRQHHHQNENKNSCQTSTNKTLSSNTNAPVWSCCWSNDGQTLATCHGRPSIPCIRIWKFEHDSWVLSATLFQESDGDGDNDMTRTIRQVAFAPTPNNVRYILASASFDGIVSIWEDFSFQSNGNHDRVKRTKQNNHQKQQNDVFANTAAGWECTAQLEGHENEVKDVTWNCTGTLLATCGRDKSVWIWECFLPGTIGADGNGSTDFVSGGNGDFECVAVLQSHDGDVKSVEFAPSHGHFGDGDEILISASYDDTIKVWAEDDGEWYCALTLANVHTSTIWTIALSPSGVRMVSGSADCSLAVWRFYTSNEKQMMLSNNQDDNGTTSENDMPSEGVWKCVGKLPSAHKQPVYTVHCAPSRAGHGRIASGGGDDTINIYREIDSSPDAPLFTLDTSVKKAHNGDINCIRWHPLDGTLLASGGDDGLVKIWKFSQSLT
mmetsp:Transcript_14479/g.17608  ORF Transcript_14479/g.17608 Transcript_14479/m.17608 type:complete len:475 (+) Transcript_14479:169-1593(+)